MPHTTDLEVDLEPFDDLMQVRQDLRLVGEGNVVELIEGDVSRRPRQRFHGAFQRRPDISDRRVKRIHLAPGIPGDFRRGGAFSRASLGCELTLEGTCWGSKANSSLDTTSTTTLTLLRAILLLRRAEERVDLRAGGGDLIENAVSTQQAMSVPSLLEATCQILE